MCGTIFASLDLFRSTPKCPVLLVYVAVLAYAEYSKNCEIKSALCLHRTSCMWTAILMLPADDTNRQIVKSVPTSVVCKECL